MSKITFRAEDGLVERIEAMDASKSEVMREALRSYLAGADGTVPGSSGGDGEGDASTPTPSDDGTTALDDALEARVDRLVAERLDALGASGVGRRGNPAGSAGSSARDVNVNVTLEDARAGSTTDSVGTEPDSEGRKTRARPSEERREEAGARGRECGQCGENVSDEHVYCPNCGEKATHRVFCDCGDQIRSDWSFCPSCGRRTPAADVLDRT
jgi:predicted transcriptional regulator/RNA polymerase subunit RPABC4/transcription elongation factor Spt4